MSDIRNLFAAVFLTFLVVGCATPTKSEFTAFAQAGSGYAVAVDKLLVAAGAAQVDSTSWTLVVEKQTTGMDDETYNAKNQQDISRLEQIGRLRQHAQLLGQYFGLLEALATSNAPDRTKTAIDGVVTELSKLKKELSSVTTALPDIGKVVVYLKIRSALRDELNNREKTIREHLEIQERLLKELTDQIKHALTLNKESNEQTLIIEPIVSSEKLKNTECWISTRRRILYTPLTIEELGTASRAATKLREAFEGLITGEVTIGRISALITDIEGLLSLAETIKSQGGL